uniref:Family with sequence similarity 113 n=1 Tax=Periophthalmus magnuspinnatus TaxID=409849 RepID=A0A3B3ZWZ8_9GOBI
MSNGTEYREVRQYRTEHHLLRFYFITRVYSVYMQSILDQLRQGFKPDLIIVSSCVWDMTRYTTVSIGLMRKGRCKETAAECVQYTVYICFDVSHLWPSLCQDIIEANFYSGQLADTYGLDILDLHFHFRRCLQHRMPDGVHWDALAHRSISTLLLLHVAQAWGVILKVDSSISASPAPPPPASSAAPGEEHPSAERYLVLCSDWGGGWGPVRGGCSGIVRRRRLNSRMHPYYPPAPELPPMWRQ